MYFLFPFNILPPSFLLVQWSRKLHVPIQKGNRNTLPGSEDFPWETAEKRPIITSEAIEKGEDYWIDERDLAKERVRQEAIKNRLVS